MSIYSSYSIDSEYDVYYSDDPEWDVYYSDDPECDVSYSDDSGPYVCYVIDSESDISQSSDLESDQPKSEKLRNYLEDEVFPKIYPPPNAVVIKTWCKKPDRLQNEDRVFFNTKSIRGTNERVINKLDLRRQVTETEKWPNSVHGVISLEGGSWGTGTLIGPNIVITAGHNLYSLDEETYADINSMRFLPGAHQRGLPFGKIKVQHYCVSPEYVRSGQEDYGILILSEPIGEKVGYFGLSCLSPFELGKTEINITGYPGDKVRNKGCFGKFFEMWGMKGRVSGIDQARSLFSYEIDTNAGQSGSGVFYQKDGNYYVCGIHVMGFENTNQATFLTRKIYEQIYIWIQQVVSKEYLYLLEPVDELRFSGLKFDRECASLLIKFRLNNLQTLDLHDLGIGAEGVRILAKSDCWVNLSKLILSLNRLGEIGAGFLAKNTSWTNLSSLDLGGNNIGLKGFSALIRNTAWRNLSCLYLDDNNICEKEAKRLKQNTFWNNVSFLNMDDNIFLPARSDIERRMSRREYLKSLIKC